MSRRRRRSRSRSSSSSKNNNNNNNLKNIARAKVLTPSQLQTITLGTFARLSKQYDHVQEKVCSARGSGTISCNPFPENL